MSYKKPKFFKWGKTLLLAIFFQGIFFNFLFAIDNSKINYFKKSSDVQLMNELLPSRGISSPHQPLRLKLNSKYLKKYHTVNFDTREVRVMHYIEMPGTSDTSTNHLAYYRELADYTAELDELARYRLWLNSFIGKGGQAGSDDEALKWELPVTIPEWMENWGVKAPKLKIDGSYKVTVTGQTRRGFAGDDKGWFPSFTMSQEPVFSVVGSIGRLIHIEINNEEAFGTNFKDQLKLSYKGEGNELEDNIIQEVEIGNTSLSLKGTKLTGYTENHKGLFGIKTRLKFGNLQVSTIASSEGGSQERQTLGAGTEERKFGIKDKDLSLYKHFFLEIADRKAYLDPDRINPSVDEIFRRGKQGIVVRVFVPAGRSDQDGKKNAFAYELDENKDKGLKDPATEWIELKPDKFNYNSDLRMLTVPSGRQSQSIAVLWDGVSKDNFTEFEPRDAATNFDNLVLLKSNRAPTGTLDSLMWRNVYSIGKVEEEHRDIFKMEIEDLDNERRQSISGITIKKLLGLTKTDGSNELDTDNPNIFDFENGNLILPCITQLDSGKFSPNCLTPLKRLDSTISLYEEPSDEIRDLSSHYELQVTGKQRQSTFDVTKTSYSTTGSGCLDIIEGTEVLMLNGSTKLEKNIDYEVFYEVGQITLISPRAKAPNATINISYQCTPLFQIQDKFILGTRMEYSLDAISDESMMGATFLFKNQTTTSKRPQLGREPFNQFLWGFNTRLVGKPDWMTTIVNHIPFIETKAESKATIDFEVAQSFYNPNTKGAALLDDYEQSLREFRFPIQINSWTKASPPGNTEDEAIYDPNLDFRHQGEFIWHTNVKERFANIYGATSSSFKNTSELKLLKFTLRPNDNLRGNSWGGVMRANSNSRRNQSKSRLIEIVIQGREGKLNIDLGKISEDISVAGFEPNKILDAEVLPGETTNEFDAGLDRLEGEEEEGIRWECTPTCFQFDVNETDKAQDNWEEPLSGESEQGKEVNGTENNNKSYAGITFDTEDINHSNNLDVDNHYARYSINLGEECTSDNFCEPLENGWKKYQLPLYNSELYKIISEKSLSIEDVLKDVWATRLWVGDIPNGVSESQSYIANLSIVGNTWEEGPRNTDYEIASGFFIEGENEDKNTFIVQPPEVLDSNFLKVSVINNQEFSQNENVKYQPSPNTKVERDTDTDEPLKEQSLVLNYKNFHPGEMQFATKHLANDEKDLTLYETLLLEMRPRSTGLSNQNLISVGLQMGRESGDQNSNDYYEIKMHLDNTLTEDTPSDSLWIRHAFRIDLSNLSSLKNSPEWGRDRNYSKSLYNPARDDNSLTISAVGNPSLSNINWMRLVIYADSSAPESQTGEIWINDLRLDGVKRTIGTSMTSRFQTDFADFVSLSGDLTVSNGNFVNMTEEKGANLTPANIQTTGNYSANLSVYWQKFFPETWGITIPMTLSYGGSITRPFTKPSSDIFLNETKILDLFKNIKDGELRTEDESADRNNRISRLYQTESFIEKFTLSYKKGRKSKDFFIKTFFERPGMEFLYQNSKSSSPINKDTVKNYTTKMTYDLSPYKSKSYKPFSFISDSTKYVPKFIKQFRVTPLPSRANFTVFDLTYNRSREIRGDIDGIEPPSDDTTYRVDLAHGADFSWRPLNFINTNYRISVRRDFDKFHQDFAGENFFDYSSPNKIFNMDHIVSLEDREWDRNEKWREDPDQIDSVEHVYGVLMHERSRDQSFGFDFTPRLLSFITTSAKFKSSYRHTKVEANQPVAGNEITPEHFKADPKHDFKFDLGFQLSQMMRLAEKNTKNWGFIHTGIKATKKGMDKFKFGRISTNYNISHSFDNEQYSFVTLNNWQRTAGGKPIRYDPFNFYAYQLGLIYYPTDYIHPGEFWRNIILGKGAEETKNFGHLAPPMIDDPRNRMKHRINRSLDARTNFTIPGIDLKLNGSLRWGIEYSFERDTIAPRVDTSLTWPDYKVDGTLSTLHNKFPWLKKKFTRFSVKSSYNYRERSKFNQFTTTPETKDIEHIMNPIFKLSTRMKNKIQWDFSLNGKLTKGRSNNKQIVTLNDGAETVKAVYPIYNEEGALFPIYRKLDSVFSIDYGQSLSSVFSISYNLQTHKGVQLWRWYVLLKSDIQLKATLEGKYEKATRDFRSISDAETMDDIKTHQGGAVFRPELTYHFTKKIDTKFFIRYEYSRKLHTEPDENTHAIDLNATFTMRF